MQVCTSLQTDNHASTPPLSFFTDRMPFLLPNQQCQSTEGNEHDRSFKYLTISVDMPHLVYGKRLHLLPIRLQWPRVDSEPDCVVRGPLCTFTAVPRSTQSSTLCETAKTVLAFRLSNTNKWRWWMWIVAAYWQTHSPGQLVWVWGMATIWH